MASFLSGESAQQGQGFSRAFYIANVMEILERLAWYGFFAVSSLYMSQSVANGGLGFSEAERGILQGIIPFFVYLLPVITGAFGDRIGYRKLFLIAYIILTPSYFLLGQVSDFWPFFGVYLLVAIGAAIFKPLVVGTVARSATEANRGRAFGIFYMMVNVGGFLGPVVAGVMRTISWDYVFLLSSSAMGLNLVLCYFLFPRDDHPKPLKGAFTESLKDAALVIGNGRFGLFLIPLVLGLMVAGGGWISWPDFLIAGGIWLLVNLIWDRLVTKRAAASTWAGAPMRVGNGPFLFYILTLTLFWALYNQIFLTLPLYIRDFVDTSDLVQAAALISPALAEALAPVNIDQLATLISDTVGGDAAGVFKQLTELQVRPPLYAIQTGFEQVAAGNLSAQDLAGQWATKYRQVSPEYIISIDFLMIVLFQYLISARIEGRPPFKILVLGTGLIGLSYVLGGLAHSVPMGGFVVIGVAGLFATGEMLASPKSQEYVAAVMPKEQAAMYMGFYFVSLALGFLAAGILSGSFYQIFALDMQRPFLMWAGFGGLAVGAMAALLAFDRLLAPRLGQQVKN